MSLSQHLTTGIVVAGCVGQVSAGRGWMGSRIAPAPSIDASVEQRLSLQSSMATVQQTLASLEQMPSCQKLATQNLLHSCEVFQDRRDGHQSSGDAYLESFRNLYAIRMTNCDQQDAHSPLPDNCQPLLDTDLRGTPREAVNLCLAALNSGHPNPWSTFNRVKSEGLIMCQAKRADKDKDDKIHLYKILTSAMTDINGAIILQKDELDALTASFGGIASQIQDFHGTLLQDNQEIKAQLKGFSVELTDNMSEIQKNAHVLVNMVQDAKAVILGYTSEVGSAMQLAKSRGDETDAQWAAQLQQVNHIVGVVTEQVGYASQQMLDSVHAAAYDMTQSLEISNTLTSALASGLAEVNLGINGATQGLASLNTEAVELAAKHQLMQDSSNETLQTMDATMKLCGRFFALAEAISKCITSVLDGMSTFTIYLVVTFLVSFCLMWRFVSRSLAWVVIAGFNAFYLSVFFTYVHSPVGFARSVIAHHPTFFSPVYWSVLTVVVVSILLWEGAKYLRQQVVQPSEAD